MIILPQKILKLINDSITFSSICRTIPFRRVKDGNNSTIYKTYIRTPSLKSGAPIRMLTCWIVLLFQVFAGSFSTYRLIWAIFFLGGFEHVPVLDMGYVAYGSFGFGIGAIFLVSIWWKHNEYLAFLNLLVKTPAKNDKGIDDTFSKMIPWIVPAAYSQCMCNSILFIKRSNGVQYFWGILNPAWQTDTIFVLSALYEFVTALNSWNSALFVFFTYSCYTHYLGVYLKKLG
ncbi:uncharacterized protein LOC118438281 [Folsomia candida]|nr:uncharacterized protein LOC118438281 [Folsomia candida]